MLKEAIEEVRVFAPATVANVACGYDVLGFAIDQPGDEVVVRHCDKPGLHLTAITGDDGKLPKAPEKNTAGVAALDLLKHLGMTDRGIEMEIHKKMPFGSGLGSSAASAVAGAYAVNKLIGEPLSKHAVAALRHGRGGLGRRRLARRQRRPLPARRDRLHSQTTRSSTFPRLQGTGKPLGRSRASRTSKS